MPEQVIQCIEACTVTVHHVISIPPFNLTLEQGKQIAIAVIAVWAVGLVFREIVRVISDGNSSTTEKD